MEDGLTTQTQDSCEKTNANKSLLSLIGTDRTITQESWVASLIHAWRKHRSMAFAFVSAAGYLSDEVITMEDWHRMEREVQKLYPPVVENSYLKQLVTTWIATNCVRTNDLLWDGKFKSAAAMLHSKKDFSRGTMRSKVKKETDNLDRDQRGLLVIKVRDRDTRTDWKKVK